jgi:hypothetical protein
MSEEFGQILWPDLDARGKDGKPVSPAVLARAFSDWGGRVSGTLPGEGLEVPVLSVPEFPIPQAVGVNLFRSDRQATLFNSDVKCRVVYGAGRSGQMTFDCDWRGGFVVHCTRLEVRAVGYKLPPIVDPYQAATQVILSATAGLNGARPAHPPTYTYLPETVAAAGLRQIEIPELARRVALITRYGTLGSSGDAPLGQLFVSFADATGEALAWIDASNTRAVVFGEGLALPAGARYIGLSNDSASAIDMGAIFHLGL